MFGYVSWEAGGVDGDSVRKSVFDTFPDKTKACLFLSSSAVFALDNLAAFWNAAAKLKNLESTIAGFRYAASVHDDLRNFTGHSLYQLTPEVRRAMGLG